MTPGHGGPAQPEEGQLPNRAQDWLRQAERDLEVARELRASGRHEWACLACHQAGEKAVKAVHLHNGQEAWGHVVARLLSDLPASVRERVPGDLVDRARSLDNLYIPTRYPNGHPEGAPFEHYGDLQSREAVAHAGEILEFARAEVAR